MNLPLSARSASIPTRSLATALLLALLGVAAGAVAQEPRDGPGPRRVYRDRVAPHWLAGNVRFWYRNDLRGGAREFVLVDAERGTREPAFDHARLTAGLAAAGVEAAADKLPFDRIEFVADGKAVRFEVEGHPWDCDLASYACAKAAAGLSTAAGNDGPADGDRRRRGGRRGSNAAASRAGAGSATSPDGARTARIVDHDVYLEPGDGGARVRLTEDGSEGSYYGSLSWSPDSQTLVAFRIEPGERKEVYLVESSPRDGGRARLQTRPYALPGDRFDRSVPVVFDVGSRRQQRPQVDPYERERGMPRLRWSRDGKRCAYVQVDRGHQRLRVVEIDVQTGGVRNLVDERTETFLWTAHTENMGLEPIQWLERTDELIHASEKSGYRHLYLVDAPAGREQNAITSGEWVVRGIELVDEEARQVWFRASGVHPGEDPYFVHHGRVGFDGQGLTWLTDGDGTHSVQYSPDRRFLIDGWSRVDQPPVHVLRRAADGGLVCRLEEADIQDLLADGWRPPEVFVANGRDGRTPIWGIVCRPRDFDPEKQYPVLEDIYAGPQDSFVPKAFSSRPRYQALTDLGFIVAKVDGMGTANRSKAFHDVCWHHLEDAGFLDRILWHRAVAQRYPHYDLSRVGIYGTSAGGQSAAGALLFHGDFYKAAVANCGCHDNRMDKASWNEQWMGYPVGPQYAASSNIDNAHRLRGRLLLIVGELDTNVPPESTYRFADALIKARKDFDYLVVPGAGHGAGGASGGYVQRRLQDFFVRHLLGREPPDRNAAGVEAGR